MTTKAISENTRPLSRVAVTALLLAVLTIVIVVMSSMGFRMEWWGYGSSVKILQTAALGGVTATVLSVLGIFLRVPSAWVSPRAETNGMVAPTRNGIRVP